MKNTVKFICLVLCITLLSTVFAACKKDEDDGIWTTQFDVVTQYDESIYDLNADLPELESNDKMFENSNYTLGWDAEHYSVVVTSKKDGRKWGTNPNSYDTLAENNKNQEFVNSAITVKYSLNSNPIDIMSGSAAVQSGRVSSEAIENGIKVTYWFDEYYFAIPVEYYLDGEAVSVKVDPKAIIEASENIVVSVGVAPFMCSAKNTAAGSKDSYLVIPSGSGAIMYADERSEDTPREFSGKVYGDDTITDKYNDYDVNSAVSMPFFGAKDGNSGVMGIITNGAEYASIKAQSGNTTFGYSSAYAYIDVRGQDVIYLKGIWRNKYTEKLNDVDPFVVSYYALSGDEATYSGMAKKYRDYLVKNEGLIKTGSNKLLNATLLGYYMEDDLFLGFPITTAKTLTTYKEAESILAELKDIADGSMSAILRGFGEGGVNATKVAGNYKITGVCGKKKDVESLISFADSANIDTYFNFDVLYLQKSGGGISRSSGTALNNTGITASIRQYWISTGQRLDLDNGGTISALVTRSKIQSVVDKAVKAANDIGFKNIAFNTLGNTCYSDYRDNKYPSRYNMAKDITEIVSSVKELDNKVLLQNPVSYGATAADVIVGAPIASQRDRAFDVDVPLYQIVYQGYKELYSTAINKANDQRKAFLKAIECGSGLSYVVMENYDIELRKQYNEDYGAYLYSDKKDQIKQDITEAKDLLEKVKDSTIANHTILVDDVTKTEFANGVAVYVNMSDSAVLTEIGTIPANSFKVKEG